MDPFGVIVLGSVTAIGGGTIRDMALGATPVFWITDTTYLWVIFITCLLTMILVRRPKRLAWWVLPVCDAIGLAVFVGIGVEKSARLQRLRHGCRDHGCNHRLRWRHNPRCLGPRGTYGAKKRSLRHSLYHWWHLPYDGCEYGLRSFHGPARRCYLNTSDSPWCDSLASIFTYFRHQPLSNSSTAFNLKSRLYLGSSHFN